MEQAPHIGDRVKVKFWHRYHPLAGVVTEVHPIRHYDVADPRWNDPDFDPPELGLKPERDWLVTMKVDTIPAGWDFYDSNLFQPAVNELEPE
jgi:hypothetical protein